MARIAGVDLPREKRIEVGLTYVYGIGQSTADEILAGTGINPDTRVKDSSLRRGSGVCRVAGRISTAVLGPVP